jgi:hypothetical protein
MIKTAIIRELSDGRFRVYDRKGNNKGTYVSRVEAESRLRQIEYFKHKDEEKESKLASTLVSLSKELMVIGEIEMSEMLLSVAKADSTNANLSYSYVMRELRHNHPKKLKEFMVTFKKSFDDAILNDLEEPDNIALMAAIKAVDYKDEHGAA